MLGTISVILIFSIFAIASSSSTSTTESEVHNSEASANTYSTTTTNETSQTTTTDPVTGTKTSFKDLKLGEIGKSGDLYIGLQYAKLSPSLPTLNGKEKVKKGNQVLLCFFEFLNSGSTDTTADPSEISCYVDGVQAQDVEATFKVRADGVDQYYNETIDPGCQMLSVQDFEIPKKWEKIELFFNSDCIWTLTPEDTSKEKYKKTTLFEVDNSKTVTQKGDIIYSDEYELTFKGTKLYHHKTYFNNDYYAVFKFSLKNTGDDSLDTSLFGYSMRCYQDNYYMGDASWALSKKIDKHTNIHSIDSIAPGKSADIYVAFKASKKKGSKYYMVFDDGYISNHYCGSVYAEIK